jgi:hypothetical protein
LQTCHGGGPGDGALNSAVSVSPDTRASQPSAANASATVYSSAASFTRSAFPSMTRSKGCVATLTTHRESRATLRELRVSRPVTRPTGAHMWAAVGVAGRQPSRVAIRAAGVRRLRELARQHLADAGPVDHGPPHPLSLNSATVSSPDIVVLPFVPAAQHPKVSTKRPRELIGHRCYSSACQLSGAVLQQASATGSMS